MSAGSSPPNVDGYTRFIGAARRFVDSVEPLTPRADDAFSAVGQAATDLSVTEGVNTAHSFALFAIETSGDSYSALLDVAAPPTVRVFAIPALARSVLESCLETLYMLGSGVEARVRHERAMTKRITDIRALDTQALVLLAGASPSEKADSAAVHSKNLRRIQSIVDEARSLGYAVNTGRRGRVVGIGEPRPSTTDLARQLLGAEAEYRFLSSVMHGTNWAVRQFGYELGTRHARGVAAEKIVRDRTMRMVIVWCLEWLAAATWEMFTYFGWDRHGLLDELEAAYNTIGLKQETRFWRFPSLPTKEFFTSGLVTLDL